MANRATADKLRKATRQRCEAGYQAYAKLSYLNNDNLDAQYRELRELIAAVHPSNVTKCPPGVASGLRRGKRGGYANGASNTWQAAAGAARGASNPQVYGSGSYATVETNELYKKV